MRMVVLSLFVLLLAPSVAHAEPISTAIAGMTVMQWVMVAITVASAVYGAAQQKKAMRDAAEAQRNAKAAANAAMKDRTITAVTTDAPHRFIYGEARVGSDIVAIFSSGSRDEIKHLVCLHAAHECEEIGEIYIAGKPIGPLDADGWVTGGAYFDTRTDTETIRWAGSATTITLDYDPVPGSVVLLYDNSFGDIPNIAPMPISVVGRVVTILGITSNGLDGSYQHVVDLPRVRVKKHLGIAGDPADAYLMAQQPGKWLSTATLSGFAYTVVMLDQTHPEFQGGIPSIEPIIKGAKLYDPRTGLTAWGCNNALVTYHYLTSEICGVDESDLPVAQFIAAANVCDEVQSFGALYTFNGAVTAAEDQKQVLEKMAQSMAGGLVSTTWDVWAGKYIAPVMALTQEDIVGSWAITPGVSGSDIYNGVKGQFISDENEYVVTDFTPYQNPVYVAADLREYWTNIDFPYTDTTQGVHNLARKFIEDQRNGFTIKAEFSLKTWSLKIGSRVTMTSAFFGHAGKIFRVTDKKYSPTSMVELTLKEDAAAIWDLADAVTVDATPNTDLPNPFDIDELASLTCESGTNALLSMADGSIVSRILATWPAANVTNGEIQIEWQKIGSDVWQKTTTSGTDVQTYLSPVEDGAFYTVRARPAIASFSAIADWTYATAHKVIGKTEAPPDVVSFSIGPDGVATWAAVDALDLAGYILRWQPGNNRSWGDATPLHNGIITESPYNVLIRPSGSATFLIKAIDTSGNESVNVAASVTNLGDPSVANVINDYDYRAASWPGTVTGATVVGGNLIATQDITPRMWSTNPNADMWTIGSAPMWSALTFSDVSYITTSFDVSAADAGSQLTLLSSIVGSAFVIEYRQVGNRPMWSGPGEPMWTTSAALMWSVEDWRPWPGAITAAAGRYEWRVTIASRALQGEITQLVAQLDVPDVTEVVGTVSVLAAGTAIPTTKAWRGIKSINLTLISDGGTARTARIEDRDARLITTRDGSNTAVNGTVSATIQGYV